MKNFNLISPKGNGSEYTIRFQDPIVIGKNSQIEFKFAELERAGEVVFTEDQSITITIDAVDMLPRINTTDGTSPNKPYNARTESTKTVSIPAGVYSYNEMLAQLDSAMNLFAVDLVGAYEGFAINTDANADTQTDIGFGLAYGGSYDITRLNQRDFRVDFENNISKNLTIGEFKCNGGVAGTVDSACMLEGKYIHRYLLNPKDPLPAYENANYILLKGTKTTSSQAGHIQFGLYNRPTSQILGTDTSRLFANGVQTAINPVNSDGRNGAPTTGNKYLPVYCGIRLAPYGGNLEVFTGRSGATPPVSAGDQIRDWTNAFNPIQQVSVLHQVRVADLFSDSQVPYFFFQLYQTPEAKTDTDQSYFTVIALTDDPTLTQDYGQKIVYDSRLHNYWLPSALEIATDGYVYDTPDKAESQLPYQPVVGFSDNGDGWSIAYPRITSITGTAIITDYQLAFSQELGEALNVPASSTATGDDFTLSGIKPTFALPSSITPSFYTFNARYNLFHQSNISNPWKRDSYAVFIDLPCNNYKNLSSKVNGGFRKSVLANIPAPFASNTLIEADNSNNKIVAVYEPYQSVKSDLLNNEITVNSFKITILDMKTELLAKQLSSSTINFSILCSNCAENERKQGNSNYNM